MSMFQFTEYQAALVRALHQRLGGTAEFSGERVCSELHDICDQLAEHFHGAKHVDRHKMVKLGAMLLSEHILVSSSADDVPFADRATSIFEFGPGVIRWIGDDNENTPVKASAKPRPRSVAGRQPLRPNADQSPCDSRVTRAHTISAGTKPHYLQPAVVPDAWLHTPSDKDVSDAVGKQSEPSTPKTPLHNCVARAKSSLSPLVYAASPRARHVAYSRDTMCSVSSSSSESEENATGRTHCANMTQQQLEHKCSDEMIYERAMSLLLSRIDLPIVDGLLYAKSIEAKHDQLSKSATNEKSCNESTLSSFLSRLALRSPAPSSVSSRGRRGAGALRPAEPMLKELADDEPSPFTFDVPPEWDDVLVRAADCCSSTVDRADLLRQWHNSGDETQRRLCAYDAVLQRFKRLTRKGADSIVPADHAPLVDALAHMFTRARTRVQVVKAAETCSLLGALLPECRRRLWSSLLRFLAAVYASRADRADDLVMAFRPLVLPAKPKQSGDELFVYAVRHSEITSVWPAKLCNSVAAAYQAAVEFNDAPHLDEQYAERVSPADYALYTAAATESALVDMVDSVMARSVSGKDKVALLRNMQHHHPDMMMRYKGRWQL